MITRFVEVELTSGVGDDIFLQRQQVGPAPIWWGRAVVDLQAMPTVPYENGRFMHSVTRHPRPRSLSVLRLEETIILCSVVFDPCELGSHQLMYALSCICCD